MQIRFLSILAEIFLKTEYGEGMPDIGLGVIVTDDYDEGELNYGEEGAAGDNIEEGKDIYDGGSH